MAGNCPKCGAAVSATARFCKNCGEVLMVRRRSGVGGAIVSLFIVLLVVAVVIGGCAYTGYNRAIHLDEQVKSSWAQVENVLQRRFDLVPNLVETVKGYASHEKEIFENIAEARTRYFSAPDPSAKAEAASGFERALSRLLVLTEQYPELKAQAGFRDLQAQLEGTENRIAVERMRYNDAVRSLNNFVRGLTGRIFAGWAGVKQATYFEAPAEAQAAPKVDFSK